MSTFDVLLNTEDVVVLGPPTNIDVRIDVGPKGDRGARFFVGSGDPNLPDVLASGTNPVIGDLFVNASVSAKYGWLYIYARVGQNNQWLPTLRLQPSIFSGNITTIFNNGSATINVPLGNIVPDVTILDVEKYTVQATLNNNVPAALSIDSKTIEGVSLRINFKGVEFSGGSWQQISGARTLDVTITVI